MITCFSTGLSQPQDVSLRIEPQYKHVDYETTHEVTVLCVLQDSTGRNVPLAGCQFQVDGQQHIWQFNKGLASTASTSGKWTGKYQGSGLLDGYCGITITGITEWARHILGCRVRSTAVDSSWIYEKMMIYADREYSFVVGYCYNC